MQVYYFILLERYEVRKMYGMKRIISLTGLLAVLLSAQAQYKYAPVQLTAVVSGGVSWGYTDSPDLIRGSVRPAMEAGVLLDYFFQPHFAFSTGVFWNLSGVSYDLLRDLDYSFQSGPRVISSGDRITYQLPYLEIPLGLKLATREIGYSQFFADFGVRPIYFLNPTASTGDGLTDHDPALKELHRFNLGYQTELGWKYSFGNKTCLWVSVYYKNTFLDFTSDYLGKVPDHSRINQSGLRIGFGF